jgi:phosphate starvation-inducible protein PhoH and related proteins
VTLTHHFQPENNVRLSRLCGPLDAYLRRIEEALQVTVARRGAVVAIAGARERIHACRDLMQRLYEQADQPLPEPALELALAETLAGLAQTERSGAQEAASPSAPKASIAPTPAKPGSPRSSAKAKTAAPVPARTTPDFPDTSPTPLDPSAASPAVPPDAPTIHMRRGELRGRTPNQMAYLKHMMSQDITLGIGPAGTGKTFLAVACAVDALERQSVQRLVLTRPAVEAGERLGFLPGDLAQKVDPYLRPLYDALYDLMGAERVSKAFERGLIEIAPLAFMRGRTLNHAFVILDEAQNTTREQMKMFLTRLGFGSRCVVTGDTSQIDLPADVPSGLVEAERVLATVKGVGITRFGATDVVRHPLVARIVEAYEAAERRAKP